MFCKKPPLLYKLLGKPVSNPFIIYDGVFPKMTWKANSVISKWDFMWKEMGNSYVEIWTLHFYKEGHAA
jgi:hypothetical protein